MSEYASSGELLAILTSEEKWLTYRGTLTPLFYPTDEVFQDYRFGAALTLVMRLMREGLYREESLSAPDAVARYLKLHFKEQYQEVFTVLFLDTQNRLITLEDMFFGTLSQTSVYPREIVRKALTTHAACVIVAHNHPSGEPEPSRADEILTTTLKAALALVDVRVLDHLVIAGTTHVSFAERGLL